MNVTTEIITPAKAEEYLKQNKKNRSMSKATIAKYTKAMKNEEWELNGESIKFNILGELIDGQNRLTACLKANKPFNTFVIRDLSTKAFNTLDTGKKRTLADVYSMSDEINTNILASTIKLIHGYEVYGSPMRMGDRDISNKEGLRLLDKYPFVRESVNTSIKYKNTSKHPGLSPTVVAFGYYYFAQKKQTGCRNIFP